MYDESDALFSQMWTQCDDISGQTCCAIGAAAARWSLNSVIRDGT